MTVKVVENEKELEDAFSVRRTVFIDEQNVPAEEEIDTLEEEATHFVAYHEGSPIAAGRLRVVGGYGKVERICVLKEARKTGTGKALMNKIETYALENGIDNFKLNAQTQAIPFYTRLGYDVVSEEFLDAGIPHRTMIKQI